MDNAHASNCDDLVRALYEYVDGGCSAQARQQLELHASQCPQCLEALGVEQQVRELLRSCCCEPAPEELRMKITRQLRVTRVEYRRGG